MYTQNKQHEERTQQPHPPSPPHTECRKTQESTRPALPHRRKRGPTHRSHPRPVARPPRARSRPRNGRTHKISPRLRPRRKSRRDRHRKHTISTLQLSRTQRTHTRRRLPAPRPRSPLSRRQQILRHRQLPLQYILPDILPHPRLQRPGHSMFRHAPARSRTASRRPRRHQRPRHTQRLAPGMV